MPFEFDVKAFLQHIQGLKPPYECPVKDCGKVYKSYSGIHYHLLHYDHDNPENNTPIKKPRKAHWKKSATRNGRSPTPDVIKKSNRDPLTYAEAQRLVEVDLQGQVHRINIYEPLEVIAQEVIDNCNNTEKEERCEKTPPKSKGLAKQSKKETPSVSSSQSVVKLPEACFKVLDDYVKPPKAPSRPNSYFRFIEKSVEELDEEVEYDMDEEV